MYPVQGIRYRVQGTRYKVPGTWSMLPREGYKVSGTGFSAILYNANTWTSFSSVGKCDALAREMFPFVINCSVSATHTK